MSTVIQPRLSHFTSQRSERSNIEDSSSSSDEDTEDSWMLYTFNMPSKFFSFNCDFTTWTKSSIINVGHSVLGQQRCDGGCNRLVTTGKCEGIDLIYQSTLIVNYNNKSLISIVDVLKIQWRCSNEWRCSDGWRCSDDWRCSEDAVKMQWRCSDDWRCSEITVKENDK